jgi:hypothetical protein
MTSLHRTRRRLPTREETRIIAPVHTPNVAWVAATLQSAGVVDSSELRARAIYAAIAGYREAGLLPA